jgi:hypothetical protein
VTDILTLKYDFYADVWFIERGNATRLGWTKIGPGQIITDFEGATMSDKIRQMMADRDNWHETTFV